MIHFEFEERRYSVGDEAYDCGRIHLPDGRYLRVIGWFEGGEAPVPQELEVMSTADLMGMLHAGQIGPLGVPAKELRTQ